MPTEPVQARTPGGRPVTMRDVVAATCLLLDTPGENADDLVVDGGFLAV